MSKPKVLVTHPEIPKECIDMLKEKCDVEIYSEPKPIPHDVLVNMIKGKDALFCLLTDKIDKQVIDAAGPQLKIISTMSVGYEHIDTQECKNRKITVTNTPHVSTDSVAEMTVTLLLATARRLIEAASVIKKGEWLYQWSPVWLCGQGLTGKTVGIVGMGRIGQGVLKRLLPFGIKRALYNDVFHPIKEAEAMGAVYVPFEELLVESDFIIALCNLCEQTKEIFNAKAFNLMKQNAIFINVSRGGVVQQDDLYDALKAGKIRGAGLDVMCPEPLPKDHKLTTLPNLTLTPHVASAETTVRLDMAKMCGKNILAILEGQPAPNAISL